MNWIEIEINTPSGELDGVVKKLETLGFSGFVLEDEADFLRFLEENRAHWDYVDDSLRKSMQGRSLLRFYLEECPESEIKLAVLGEQIAYPMIRRTLQEEDWANNWKKYYQPIAIGQRFLVVPQWQKVDAGERVPLLLDPGLSFGTGAHPSTQSCLCLAEDKLNPGQKVLDLGTGSGILAIAALKLGAEMVIACDIDPQAEKAVRENMKFNALSDTALTFYSGNVLEDHHLQEKIAIQKYDVIFANIIADVIIPLAPMILPLLADEGTFICAGIISGREKEVETALKKAGLRVQNRREQQQWFAFSCKK